MNITFGNCSKAGGQACELTSEQSHIAGHHSTTNNLMTGFAASWSLKVESGNPRNVSVSLHRGLLSTQTPEGGSAGQNFLILC